MTGLFIILLMGLFVFMGVRLVLQRPELFQSKLISKGIGTLGFLALGLILLVTLGVVILEAS